jgi:hypothetical protein
MGGSWKKVKSGLGCKGDGSRRLVGTCFIQRLSVITVPRCCIWLSPTPSIARTPFPPTAHVNYDPTKRMVYCTPYWKILANRTNHLTLTASCISNLSACGMSRIEIRRAVASVRSETSPRLPGSYVYSYDSHQLAALGMKRPSLDPDSGEFKASRVRKLMLISLQVQLPGSPIPQST